MKTVRYLVVVFIGLLLWSFSAATCIAQTTAVDVDTILESYRQEDSFEPIFDTVENDIDFPNFVPPRYNGFLGSYGINEVPSPRGVGIMGYVSDPDDVITAGAEQRINRTLYELEKQSSVEVAIVVLPSIGQEVPKDFAVQLFEKWGIGKSDTDNGLLILTIMDQRRTEFEVGYGLEPILTDVVCYRIGVNEIVPSFKQGDYDQGLENAVFRIKEFLEHPEVIDEVYGYGVEYDEGPFRWQFYHLLLLVYLVICMIIGFWYFGQAFDIERSKDDYYDKYHRLHQLKFGCTSIVFPLPMLFFSRMVKKRLQGYRIGPRFSKKNGMPMKLLTNYDEIDVLKGEQLLEEELRSILYDVWVTDDKSDIMILEYEGPNGRDYSKCIKCSYKTFGKLKTRITIAATYDRSGTRLDTYECRNCNYQEEKEIKIPQKVRASSSSSGSSYGSSSSSGSSSSFGGGSSGGGGSGVSW